MTTLHVFLFLFWLVYTVLAVLVLIIQERLRRRLDALERRESSADDQIGDTRPEPRKDGYRLTGRTEHQKLYRYWLESPDADGIWRGGAITAETMKEAERFARSLGNQRGWLQPYGFVRPGDPQGISWGQPPEESRSQKRSYGYTGKLEDGSETKGYVWAESIRDGMDDVVSTRHCVSGTIALVKSVDHRPGEPYAIEWDQRGAIQMAHGDQSSITTEEEARRK